MFTHWRKWAVKIKLSTEELPGTSVFPFEEVSLVGKSRRIQSLLFPHPLLTSSQGILLKSGRHSRSRTWSWIMLTLHQDSWQRHWHALGNWRTPNCSSSATWNEDSTWRHLVLKLLFGECSVSKHLALLYIIFFFFWFFMIFLDEHCISFTMYHCFICISNFKKQSIVLVPVHTKSRPTAQILMYVGYLQKLVSVSAQNVPLLGRVYKCRGVFSQIT